MINIFYDTETTGTNPNRHSIHQLSGYVEKDGLIVETFDYKIKPHPKAELDDYALKVSNVTAEQIQEYPDMKIVFKQFTSLLKNYIDNYDPTDKAWLIGFNNRAFDDGFLRKFFELCGNRFFNSYFWSDSIDVSVLASQYLKERRQDMPSFKLKRVGLELGFDIEKEDLHDALYDATLTRQIYYVVTGKDEEPNESKFYYLGHAESGSYWKQMEFKDEDLADGQVDLFGYKAWRKRLKEEGLKDGPHLIQDDLF